MKRSLRMHFANRVPAIRSHSGEASSENKTLTSSVCLCPIGRLFSFFFGSYLKSAFLGAKVCGEVRLLLEGSGGSAQVEEGAEFSPSGEAADLSTSCCVK